MSLSLSLLTRYGLSRGAAGPPPDPGGASWLWKVEPTGSPQNVSRAGFVFTANQALQVTRTRHASTSAIETSRFTHLYQVANEMPLANQALTSETIGWSAATDVAAAPILWEGRDYMVVGGQTSDVANRLTTIAVGDRDFSTLIAYVRPATSTSDSFITFPAGGEADSILRGVDIEVEPYAAPTGEGWCIPIAQMGARNDSSQGGWAFTPTEDITATSVRVGNNGNSADYTVRIWRASDQTVVASATFSATGLTTQALGSAVDLDEGVQYVITVARNTSTIIRTFSDLSANVIARALVTFDGGRSAASDSGFPGTSASVFQAVDLYVAPR